MKRLLIPNLVLAAVLALLPLEQLPCVCAGLRTPTAPVASQKEHSCCESRSSCAAGHQSSDQPGPHGCVCPEMVPIQGPAASENVLDTPTLAPLAVSIVPEVIAPVSILTETAPAFDVESPPLPADPGAHGLRAPPAIA